MRRIVALRYESGDAAGAISEYRTFESRLREEMGVDPMPETVALAERVVRGDIAGEDDGDAMAAPVPRGDERRRLLPFAGREREIERLSEAWSRAKMQRGGIVFIGGEPGIGKSRLVREFMASVEESGGRALYGATGFPEAFPYQCLVNALREQLPLVAATDIGATWFAALTSVLPELESARRAAAGAAGNPRLRSAAAALRRVGTGARRAGAAAAAARRARRSALGEPGDLRRARVFAATNRRRPNSFLGDVSRQRNAGTPSTAPARPRSDGRRQCGLAFGTAARPQRSSSESSRFPALLRTAHRSPSLRRRCTVARAAIRSFSLSSSKRPRPKKPSRQRWPRWSRRASPRSPRKRRPLPRSRRWPGQRFSAELVRDVTGYGEAIVERALDELLDHRLVQETTGRGILPYAFGHQLVKEAIAALVEPQRLRERSRRLARALRELYPERNREFASQIGSLLEAAESFDEAAGEYAASGAYALDLGAPDDARRDVDRALGLAADTATVSANLAVASAHRRAREQRRAGAGRSRCAGFNRRRERRRRAALPRAVSPIAAGLQRLYRAR